MIIPRLVQGLSIARSGLYFLESIPILLINRWFTNKELDPPTNQQIVASWRHLIQLHESERDHLEKGVYPLRALEVEIPWSHFRSFIEVLGDGFRVAWRMRKNATKDFNAEGEALKKDLPEYYARNFHFQTDGYLSEASARRYDHQVEILFTGTAGAMRRLILPILKRFSAPEGRWLEIACGAGSATRPVLETFPKVRVTAMDLSPPYLKVAQDKLRGYENVDFLRGDATALDFKNETFDNVYSVYLLHELPRKEREKVLREAYRVLKPGGLLVLADSLQTDDEPELNWALERFPRVYHEPFYKDYLGDRLEHLLKKVTGETAGSAQGFFTKVVWVKKPLAPSSDA